VSDWWTYTASKTSKKQIEATPGMLFRNKKNNKTNKEALPEAGI